MLSFYVTMLLVLLIATGIFWRWRENVRTEIREGAAIEWANLQKNEPEFLEGYDEAGFNEVYNRVYEPRFPGYALAAFATFILSFPVILIALTALAFAASALGAIPEPIDVARQMNLEGGEIKILGQSIDEQTRYQAALYYIRDLSGFYYFFGILISWLGIVAFFMRRFHGRRPGYLRDEVIRSRPSS